MGKKTDFFTGKRFNTSKFKILTKLALSRISILKNQHQARSSYAQSDVIELLNLGHHQRALLRVEYVIHEHNTVDMFCMIESYCNQLIDKVKIIRNKECPDELKEPISILFLAAPRCGEFPELQQIRNLFESWFGSDFASHATDVNPKIIQKLSTQQPSLENRMKLLEMLALENGIALKLDKGAERYAGTRQAREQQSVSSIDVHKLNQHEPNKPITLKNSTIRVDTSESTKARMKYRNGADAALEAFESFEAAAHAAAVARVGTRLSQSEVSNSHADLSDHEGSRNQDEILSNSDESLQSSLHIDHDTVPQAVQTLALVEIQHIEYLNCDSEVKDIATESSCLHKNERIDKTGGTKSTCDDSDLTGGTKSTCDDSDLTGGTKSTCDDSDLAAEIKILDEKRMLSDKPHQTELFDKKTIHDASKAETKKELADE